MTASQLAKSYGLKSVREAAKISDVPERTLFDWFNTKPELFKIICLGCISTKCGSINGEGV